MPDSDAERALFFPVVVRHAAHEHHLAVRSAPRRPQRLLQHPQPVPTKFYRLAHADTHRESQRRLKPRVRRNLNARSYRAAQPWR